MGQITIATTTDSAADVRAALGVGEDGNPVEPTKQTEPAKDAAPKEAKPDAAKEPDKEAEAASKAAKELATPKTPEPTEAAKTLAQRRGKLQERIDTLTREKYTHARERDQAMAQVAKLQKQIEELTKSPAAKPASEPAAPAAGPTKERPKVDDYDDYDQFVEALSDWKTEQRLAEREAAAAKAAKEAKEAEDKKKAEDAFAKAEADFHARIDKVREAHPDFDAVLEKSADVNMSRVMMDHVRASENGPELLYYFATNPDECAALAAQPPGLALVQLGRLEAKLEAGQLFAPSGEDGDTVTTVTTTATQPAPPAPSVAAAAAAPAAPVSRAPVMISRAGGGGHTAPPKDPSQMSYSEYKEWRSKGGGR